MNDNHDKNYIFENLDLVEFTKITDTPCYIISENLFKKNIDVINTCFKNKLNYAIYYSVKTNFESQVMYTAKNCGLGAEASGLQDLLLIEKAGFSPDRIILDSPNKQDFLLERVIRQKIHLINVETEDELKRINVLGAKYNKKVDVGLRVNLTIKRFDFRNFLIKSDQKKYGFEIPEIMRIACAIHEFKNIRFCGLLTHLTKSFTQPEDYRKALKILFSLSVQLKEAGINIAEINLGGGFPSEELNYRFARKYRLKDYFSAITTAYFSESRKTGLNPRISIEPGKSLIDNTAIILGKIVSVHGKWALTDITTNNDLGYYLPFTQRRFVIANKARQQPQHRMNIGAATLNQYDKLYLNVRVPELEKGDIMAIFDVGAYSIPVSSQFMRARGPVFFLDSSGNVQLIRRRETIEDVTRTQIW